MEDIALKVIKRNTLVRLFLVIISGLLVFGCAGTKEIKKDPFFEK